MTNNDYFEKKKIMIDSEDFLNEIEHVLQTKYSCDNTSQAFGNAQKLLDMSNVLTSMAVGMLRSNSEVNLIFIIELEQLIFDHSMHLIDAHLATL